jgi:hypothetical protein
VLAMLLGFGVTNYADESDCAGHSDFAFPYSAMCQSLKIGLVDETFAF